MEKAFFKSSQTCTLIGRSKNLSAGAMTVKTEKDNKMDDFVQVDGYVRSNWLEWKKRSTSKGRPLVSEYFPLVLALHLHFNRLN